MRYASEFLSMLLDKAIVLHEIDLLQLSLAIVFDAK